MDWLQQNTIGNLRVIYWYDEIQNTIYIDHMAPEVMFIKSANSL